MGLSQAGELLSQAEKQKCEPISMACKAYRSGKTIPIGSHIWVQLMLRLLECKTYASLANRVLEGKCILKLKTTRLHGRQTKHVQFALTNKPGIPITKARLYAEKTGRARCRACGCTRKQCKRNKNLAELRAIVAYQLSDHRLAVRDELASLAEKERTLEVARRIHTLTHCPYSDKLLMRGATHVDHIKPFSQLVKDWVAISPQSRLLCERKLSKDQLVKFDKYHAEHAQLVLCNAKANLQKGSKLKFAKKA